MGIDRPPRRAVFLDRDGVITRAAVRNGTPFAPLREEELEILPDVPASLNDLRRAGFRLVVVTNQPEVARGNLPLERVERMHERLARALPIDEFLTCAHDDDDRCHCRKPAPGLLERAARHGGISLRHSFMIGDRWRDVEAAQRAGCVAIFIDYGYDEPRPSPPYVLARSLREAADWILSNGGLA